MVVSESTTPPTDAKPVASSFLNNKLKFSRKSLIIFIVVFGCLGAFLLWRTFAATPEVIRQEAENMGLPTRIAKIATNKNTKSGKHVTFSADLNDTTKASSPVMFPNKVSSVSVVAYGNEYNGQCSGRPYVGLKIDNTVVIKPVREGAINNQVTDKWAAYSATIPVDLKLDKGTTHTVQLLTSNVSQKKDAKGKVTEKCNRLLAVDTIIFYGENGSTTPVPTVSLGVSPASIQAGSSSTLTWSSSNVKSCTASGAPGAWSGSIEPNKTGTRSTGALSTDTTYNLSCVGEDGKAINAAPAKITVVQSQPQQPSGGGSAAGWNGFGPGNWPGANWRPYAANSPFNQAVTNPVIHPQSSAIVATALSKGIGNLTTGAAPEKDYAHPIYYAQSTDPLVTINAGSYGLTGTKIRVPAGAKAAGGGDGHIAIVQPDGMEYDFWRAAVSGSTLNASTAYRQRYDGMGIVTPAMIKTDKETGGTTAPYFGQHAGIIRASELAAGKINHALFLVIECGSSDTSFGYGAQPPGASGRGGSGSFVYPAFKGDAACSGTRAPMGARFWLNMTAAQIDATGAPAWERTIAKAMNEYGGYMGDTGGPGFAFQFESSLMYTALGYPNPFEPIAQAAGLKKDPTWGYTFKPSGKIPWAQNMRVITPPSQ